MSASSAPTIFGELTAAGIDGSGAGRHLPGGPPGARCRFALRLLQTRAQAQRAAAQHLDDHPRHHVETRADVSLPLLSGCAAPLLARACGHVPGQGPPLSGLEMHDVVGAAVAPPTGQRERRQAGTPHPPGFGSFLAVTIAGRRKRKTAPVFWTRTGQSNNVRATER